MVSFFEFQMAQELMLLDDAKLSFTPPLPEPNAVTVPAKPTKPAKPKPSAAKPAAPVKAPAP